MGVIAGMNIIITENGGMHEKTFSRHVRVRKTPNVWDSRPMRENSVTIDTDIDTDTDINKTPMVCGLTADNDNRVYW